MADARQKWQDATRQILLALDLAAEYAQLGLSLASSKPNSKGWIYCHSADAEVDRGASAGICVADGPCLGRYKDFRSGRTNGLFDFAANTGKFAGDWKEARNHYARVAGVKLPGGEEELVADRMDFYDLTAGVLMLYAKGKPGVTVRALLEVGARGARWPKKASVENTNHMLTIPMYGSALLDLEPTAWHCCNINPRGKLLKYQGEGVPLAAHKVLTFGEYGLMNEWGLHRLAEADVVWLVEGLSDLLAFQSVLGPWLEAHPTEKHVVLSAGGCTYRPRPEWMQHFIGKRVRVLFDVGDKENEGQIGAAVWVGALLPVAKEVKNVQLPLGASDQTSQKNDCRAWLLDGHGYDDLLALAETFPAIEKTDETAQLSQNEAILLNLGLVVIGEHEGSQKIEAFSERTKKSHTIQEVDKLTIVKLIQFLGPEAVETYVHDGKEQMPGKYRLSEVKNAIAAVASGRVFHSDERFGAGVWKAGDDLVLVKAKEVGILSTDCSKISTSSIPFHNGCTLDIAQSTGNWVDFGQLGRYLIDAGKPEWCQNVLEELETLIGHWYFRHKSAPRIVAGLVLASWVQTLWHWRPQVFLTGSSDTGKSLLLEDVIANGLFGSLAMYVQKPTEAAIRQHMKHHAKVPILDEFEQDIHRQRILELFRTASRGGETIRGTADQRGAKYRLRHIPWLAAIETGLRKQADINRYIILDLEELPIDVRGKIRLPKPEAMRDLGVRCLAVALRNFAAAAKIAEQLKGEQYDGVPGRQVECFSVPMGMVAAIHRLEGDAPAKILGNVLRDWDFAVSSGRDDESVLREIMTSEVQTDGGKRTTVSQLLADGDITASSTLARVGLKKFTARTTNKHTEVAGQSMLWFEPDIIRRNLIRHNGDFAGHNVGQYLSRIEGAVRSRQRLGGHQRFWGYGIPMEKLDQIFDVETRASEDGSAEVF